MEFYINNIKKTLNKMIKTKNLIFVSKDYSNTKNKKIIQMFNEVKNGFTYKDKWVILKNENTGILVEFYEKKDKKKLKNIVYGIRHIYEDIYNYYMHQKMNIIVQSLQNIKNFDGIYNLLVKEICEGMDFEKGVFCRYDPNENLIYGIPPGYGINNEKDILTFRFKLDEKSAAQYAISTKSIYFTNDAENDPYIIKRFSQYFNAYKVVVVPFFYGEKLVGVFYGARGKNRKDIDDEIPILKLLSFSISLLVNYLVETERSQKREESILELQKANVVISTEIDIDKVLSLISEEIVKLLDADASSLMILDIEKNGFVIKSYTGLSEEYANKQFIPFERIEKYLVNNEYPVKITEDLRKQYYGDLELIKREGIVSCLSAKIIIDNKPIGILNVYQKKLRKFTEDDILIIKAFAAQASVAIKNARFYERIVHTTENFIVILSEMEALKDLYTLSHSENVATIALKIGMLMGLSQNMLDDIYRAGLLHDVGKIIVEKNLLTKPEKLTDEEMVEVKKHVEFGKNIIDRISEFETISEYIYYHHERFDGKGYPKGLKNNEIPLGARILAVADAIEAMLSERPYRSRMSIEDVKKELIKEKGKQFDPHIVDIAIKII